jgi:TPR repeat protein
MMFAAGKGVPQSISTAYLWIARAAEGDVSTRGLSDISKAAIAGQNGTAKAISARDSIRSRMNAEQIADAQILVDRCVAIRSACNWGD